MKQIIRYFLFITSFHSALVFGQEYEYRIYNEIKETRTLGGHYFTPSNSIKLPFILTHVKTSLGIGGINDLRYPLINLGEKEFLYLQGDIYTALLSIEYQHAVKDWLAVYLRSGLIGRLGSDFGTLIKQGVNYATSFDIGWMVRVYRNDNYSLSTNFGVSNGNYSFISLQNFVQDVINEVPNSSIIMTNNSLYGLFGLKAAHGFNQFIGINIVADLGYGEAIPRELENTWFTILGVNADLNFTDLINTPLSVSLGYLYSSYPKTNDDIIFNNNVILTQLNYIGRSNFILSLDISFSRELVGNDENTIWLNSTMFSMRYLF
jgi:hypothetical protein